MSPLIIKTTFRGLKPYYQIAQQFDNLTAGLEIDCTDAAESGDAAAVLIRGVDGKSYPALSTYADGILRYSFTAADLKTPGNIYVQLAIYGPAGEVKHSKLAALHVAQSIPGDAEPPEALTSWLAEAARTLENLKKYGSDAEKSAIAAAASEKNAAEEAEAALVFASAAALSEISAKSQAEAATTAASQAQSSASSAARDASSANTSAQSAAESASTATTAASTATDKASAAAGSASAAQSAKTAAETAKSSAETAKTAAETAQTAAEEARDASAASATEAAQSAQTAQMKAQEIAESAEQIAQNKTRIDKNERSLNALWKLNEGQTYDIETVEETGMNEAPSGAKYMSPEEIYGKTEQVSTTGKNAVEIETPRTRVGNVDYSLQDGKISAHGITLTRNDDGTYTLNGTATLLNENDKLEFSFPCKVAVDTVYKLTGIPSGSQGVRTFASINGSPWTIYGTDSGNGMKITPSSENSRIVLKIPEGTTLNNVLFKPMLSLDLTATYDDYEPYTGGIPAPNPYYPQEIHSIDKIQVKHIGANLFDAVAGTVTPTGEFIRMPDTPAGSVATEWLIPVKGSRVYCRKAKAIDTEIPTMYTMLIRWYDSSKNFLSSSNGLEPYNTEKNIAVPQNARYFRVTFTADIVGFQNIIDTYQPMVSFYDVPSEPFHSKSRTITPPRPLNAIGNFKDTLDIENGEWVYKNAVYTFSGDDNATILENPDGTILLNGTILFKLEKALDTIETEKYTEPYMCDTFTRQTARSTTDTIGSYIFDKTLRTRVPAALATTTKDFQTWLRTHNVKLVYAANTIETLPADHADLEWLRDLANAPASDYIIITDQDGNDVQWLNEYIISLREAVANG